MKTKKFAKSGKSDRTISKGTVRDTTIVTQAYNADWQKKIKDQGRFALQERVYDALSRLFKDVLHERFEGRILDVGAGDGSVTAVLNRHRGIRAQGIDISDGVNFETDPLPYRDSTFDIAIMYAVIEHLNNAGNIFSELRRVLKRGGKVIIITSNMDLSRRMVWDRNFYDDPTHVHPYNPTSMEHLLRLYQFRKRFLGVWMVPRYSLIWKLPMNLQFHIGALLPFRGMTKYVPFFLKGRSKSMMGVFENEK